MTLTEWVDKQGKTPAERRALRQRIADACGCTPYNVEFWYYEQRPVPAKYALVIERETDGKVRAADIIQAAA